jgi:hypothetical protein
LSVNLFQDKSELNFEITSPPAPLLKERGVKFRVKPVMINQQNLLPLSLGGERGWGIEVSGCSSVNLFQDESS